MRPEAVAAETHNQESLAALGHSHVDSGDHLVGDAISVGGEQVANDLNDGTEWRGRWLCWVATLATQEARDVFADNVGGADEAGHAGEFVDELIAGVVGALLAGVAEALAVVDDGVLDNVRIVLGDFEVVDGGWGVGGGLGQCVGRHPGVAGVDEDVVRQRTLGYSEDVARGVSSTLLDRYQATLL
jgi:hypothetical protein